MNDTHTHTIWKNKEEFISYINNVKKNLLFKCSCPYLYFHVLFLTGARLAFNVLKILDLWHWGKRSYSSQTENVTGELLDYD